MRHRDELRHLRRGAEPGERPRRGGTVLPAVVMASDPATTIERARAVLLAVLTAPRGWSADRPPQLPAWFVDACAPEVGDSLDEVEAALGPRQGARSAEEARADSDVPWSLGQWLHWFEGERYWFWWDARVSEEHELVAEYVVYDWPAPTGSLIWLWRACGALDVDVF